MADAEDKIVDVLLPPSRIGVFAQSAETLDVFNSLKQDWRFARVENDIQKATIDDAIQHYQDIASPDVIIIETDDISEAFTDKLNTLAAECEAGTEAVIIGPQNDVQLYRRLVNMGVRDYLVRPAEREDIVHVISRSLFDKMGISESRLVAVIGAKGGVGTTSVAQNLAQLTAVSLKQKTLLMDASGGWSTMNVAFGIEASAGLAECVRNAVEGSDEDLERMYTEINKHLTLFACGGDDLLHYTVDGDMYEKSVDRVMKTFPVVYVDLSNAPADVRYRIIDRAHEVIIVTTPSLTALRMARTLLSEVKVRRGDNKGVVDLIVNKKGRFGGKEMGDKDIIVALDHTPEAVIPWLPDVFNESEAVGKIASEIKGGQPIKETLLKLAAKSANTPVENIASQKERGVFHDFLARIKGK